MKYIIACNWKMNPQSIVVAKTLYNETKKQAVKKSKKLSVVICPPTSFLGLLTSKDKKVLLGAQDVSSFEKGSHTGEVGAEMLQSLGVKYVIVGHSERRGQGESGSLVAEKVSRALKAKLTPIICVGESLRDKEGNFFNDIREMIDASLAGVSKKQIKDIVLAYEPVWAIGALGSGVMENDLIQETTIFIRKVLMTKYGNALAHKVPILYGGSVDQKNAKGILTEGGVNGLLIGRASLDIKSISLLIDSI